MIEIRELIIRAVVTKNDSNGQDNKTTSDQGSSTSSEFEELMEIFKEKNER